MFYLFNGIFFYFCEWNLFAREIENILANQASRAISLVSNCPTNILFCLWPKEIFCENVRTWSLELLKWMAAFLSFQHLMARCHKQRSIFYLLDRFQFLFNFSFKLLHGAILAVLIILTHALFLGWCTFTCVLLKQSWCCRWSRVARTCRDGASWYAIIHISTLLFSPFLMVLCHISEIVFPYLFLQSSSVSISFQVMRFRSSVDLPCQHCREPMMRSERMP